MGEAATVELSSVLGGEPTGRGSPYESTNPAHLDDVVARVSLAAPADLVEACRVAREAQRGWSATPAPGRGQVIGALGRLAADRKEELAALITREVGKPIVEARGEVQELIDTCEFFSGEGRRLYGMTVPSELPDKQLFTFREPVGVVLVITAGNFPAAVPSWYVVPALLCGNAVVWKPAEYAAAIADALHRLCRQAGVPPGVLNLVHADGPTTFAGLSAALDAGVVDKVGFTGSSAVGSRIGELCGRHLQSPCLELGGKNPLVVMPDADVPLAVAGAVFSGFAAAGQRCTSLGTVLVHRDLHEEFLARLSAAVRELPVGDPAGDVAFGPLLDRRFVEQFLGHLSLIAEHHRVSGSDHLGRITSAAPRRGFQGDPATGWYVHPVVVDGLRATDELFLRETFGPIVGVTSFGSLEEAIELANAPGYGLSAAIYTGDAGAAFRFHKGVSAGMVSVNNSTCGAEAHLPFGGNGRSGNGSRQSGVWVLDQMTRWQAVNWDYAGRLQRAQIDVDG